MKRGLDAIACDMKHVEIVLKELQQKHFTLAPEGFDGKLWVECSYLTVQNFIDMAYGFMKNVSDELFEHYDNFKDGEAA